VTALPPCPKCASAYVYADRDLLTCPECAHEWTEAEATADAEAQVIRDANGTALENGDTVVVIKDLKVKGASGAKVKVGTKVRNIRLVPGGDHDIDCKVDGFGQMGLKSEFVKKVSE